MEKLESLFYHIRDDKKSDLFKGLDIILESRNPWWCYRCASMCIKDSRIPSTERPEYTIKFAKVVFENLNYDLIVRFLKKVARKPAYQEFIKSEYVMFYSNQAYQKYLSEAKETSIKEAQRKETELKFLSSVPYVEELTETQKYSRLVCNAKSLEEKSLIVEVAGVAYFSYKYIKEVLTTTKIPQEVKKALVIPHAEFVFESEDENTKKKLGEFLQYKPLYKEYVIEKQKSRTCVPQK